MNIGDTVIVRTTRGVQRVKVLEIEHPEAEGTYILNDIVKVEFADGETALYYHKHLDQTGNNKHSITFS